MKGDHMKRLVTLTVLIASFSVLAGCSAESMPGPRTNPTTTDRATEAADEESEIRSAMAKLSDEDRKLAEAQRYCVVQNDSRLGSMGPPPKVMVKGQPVFLCCKGCEKKALADPDKTLAKVEQLKEKEAREPAK